MDPAAAGILALWFGGGRPADREVFRPAWFDADPAFDAEIARRLGAASAAAVAGGLTAWESGTDEALALVLLLDQVPRQCHRGGAAAFAGDARARRIAAAVIGRGGDLGLGTFGRLFLYLPFEHSENLDDQDTACRLIAALGNAELSRHAAHHRDLIRRFGRFPHRNQALGRVSSEAERLFLAGAAAAR